MAVSDPIGSVAAARDFRAIRNRALCAWLYYAATVVFIFTLVSTHTPALQLWLFAGGNIIYLALWAAGMIAYVARRPDDSAMLRVERPAVLVVTVFGWLLNAAMPWLLMPFADDALVILLALFNLGYVVISVMFSVYTGNASGLCIILVLGSLAAYLMSTAAWMPPAGPLALPAGLYLAVMALFLWGIRHVQARNLFETLRAQAATEAALAEVAAARDAKTRFIAAASHDLAQPLQAAGLFVAAASTAQTDADRTRATAGVNAALHSASALLEQMLDHLRLEAGAVSVRTQSLALASLLPDIAAGHHAQVEGARMTLRLVPTSLAVNADATLLTRALGNLIVNAARHSRGTRIVIGARGHGARVRLWVIDDGTGIAASDTARIFEDYVQGSSDTAAPGGFGLGLASARRAAVAMDGSAGLDARWMRGCAFYIDLPRAETLANSKSH